MKECTYTSWYSRECMAETDAKAKQKKLLNNVFLCAQKVFSQLNNITVESLISHGLFWSLLPFWALNVSVALLSMRGQKALEFHQKYPNLCFKDE